MSQTLENVLLSLIRWLFYSALMSEQIMYISGMKMGQGEKGEKDMTPLGGSGGMVPRKKMLNISYVKASI